MVRSSLASSTLLCLNLSSRSFRKADHLSTLFCRYTALAGVAHAAANSFPLLMLAGASESFQQNQGAFQELDQVGLLKGETK